MMSRLEIELNESSWQTANLDFIKSVLLDSANNIYRHLTGSPHYRIVVYHKQNGCPTTLYRRVGEDFDQIVLTNSPLEYQRQIMYQFAHEFCHVVSNHNFLRSASSKNGWFHESLCELASMYTMHQSNDEKDVTYLDKACLNRAKYVLSTIPDGQFGSWLRERETQLRETNASNGYCRLWNAAVAYRLFGLFERHPATWNIVRCLPKSESTLARYLQEWENEVHQKEKQLVDHIGLLLT